MYTPPGGYESTSAFATQRPDAWIKLYNAYAHDAPTWIHRRVERIEVIDERLARRQVTLDMSLPEGALVAAGRVWVPVAYVPKKGHKPLGRNYRAGPRQFDTRDAQGATLPVLTTLDARWAGYFALCEKLSLQGVELTDYLKKNLLIAVGRSPLAENHDKALASVIEAIAPLPDSTRLTLQDELNRMSSYFLLITGLSSSRQSTPPPATRMLVKFDYVSTLGLRPTSAIGRLRQIFSFDTTDILIETPEIGHCESYHLEFVAPPDLEVTKAGLIYQDSLLTVRAPEDPAPGAIAHLHARDVSTNQVNDRARAIFFLRTVLRRWHYMAAGVSLVSLAGLLLATALPERDDNGDALVALLIAAPSATVAAFMREAANGLTSRIVRPIRVLAFGVSSLMFVGAWVYLIGSHQVPVRETLRALALVTAMLAAFQLIPFVAHGNRLLNTIRERRDQARHSEAKATFPTATERVIRS